MRFCPLALLPLLLTSLHVSALGAEPKTPSATPSAASDTATERDAEAEWQELETALKTQITPQQPAEWETKTPDEATLEAWKQKEAQRLLELAERFRQFSAQHPEYPKAKTAHSAEHAALGMALDLGNESAGERLDALLVERLKDPALLPDERYMYRFGQLIRGAKTPEDLETVARLLKKEFPTRSDHDQLLIRVAQQLPPERARAIIEEILKGDANEETKAQARALKEQIAQIGGSMHLKFTALDGREVDLAKLKGKVVLIDFWATWCTPCLNALPELKAVYEEYHPKGLEIIGFALDEDRATLEKLIREEKIPWAQHFDGKAFESEFIKQHGITGIPALWLIDREGKLRMTNAETNLRESVKALLKEK